MTLVVVAGGFLPLFLVHKRRKTIKENRRKASRLARQVMMRCKRIKEGMTLYYRERKNKQTTETVRMKDEIIQYPSFPTSRLLLNTNNHSNNG